MNREWNGRIAMSLVAASLVAGVNLWYLTEYRPLSSFWELLALSSAVLGLIFAPLLTYHGIKTEKKWPVPVGYFVLLAALSVGVLLAVNGRTDPSAVIYHFGTVTQKEIGETKSGASVYRFKIRLDDPPHGPVTVGTTRLRYEQAVIGTRVGVPAKAGRLGIPWRVYHVPVSYPGERRAPRPL